MKRNKAFIVLVTVLVLIASIACNAVSRRVEATPTSDYIFPPVTTPLKFEPDSLPAAQVGAAYDVQIQVSDNVTPISDVGILDGALPEGIELVLEDQQEDSMRMSGTPTQSGTFTFTVFVSCFGTMVSGQSGQKEYTIIVK